MPGQHDLNKHQIAVKFTHHVWRQIEKAAANDHGKTPGAYIRDVVTLAVGSIELTSQDAEIIARRIRCAESEGRMKRAKLRCRSTLLPIKSKFFA